MSVDTCCDGRFELIEEAKRKLLKSTNIEDRPEELAVLDSILFRLWQMGWLDQLREDKDAGTCKDCKHSHMTSDGKHCKWCSVLATHEIDSEEYCDPPNGYDPEPYFDADFYCGFFKRRTHLNIGAKAVSE